MRAIACIRRTFSDSMSSLEAFSGDSRRCSQISFLCRLQNMKLPAYELTPLGFVWMSGRIYGTVAMVINFIVLIPPLRNSGIFPAMIPRSLTYSELVINTPVSLAVFD